MENFNENISMEDMMEQIENSMKKIREGQIIKGKVISVSEDEILVNIGYVADGIIKNSEFNELDKINIGNKLSAEDDIYVYVVKLNDGEGNVILSKKIADEIMMWKQLENRFKENKIFDIEIKEIVKGGAIGYIDNIRAFIPASQISYRYVKDLNEFLNEKLTVKIIEINKKNKKLVLSAKEVEKQEIEKKKEILWNSLKKGEKRRGKVTKFMKFGAFIDLGGLEGLIHLNDLSWKRVNSPSEVLSIGDEVNVFVLDLDKDRNRISLALKDVEEDPWNNVNSKYKIGDILTGKVVKMLDFGAFVEIADGVEGLVHITELSNERILKPDDVLKLGDVIKVKILELDEKNKRISLSIKAVDDTMQKELEKYNDNEVGISLGELLKDKLKNLNSK